MPAIETKKLRTEETKIRFTGQEIITALRASGYKVPFTARVFVRVPGGGDYSNMSLDIDATVPLVVEFEISEEEADG
jgi:hypothetical protein